MKLHHIFLSIFLISCLSNQSRSQNLSAENPFFFIQITDPQLGMIEENDGFEKETRLFEKAVAEINRLNPDFVVITGDFVHDPDDELQINEFKRIRAKINPGIPVHLIPGNHDIGQVPDNESLQKYESNYGSDRFAFSHKGSKFIGYNSSLIKANVPEHEKSQLKWLKETLSDSKSVNHTILFGHYPFFNKSVDEPEKYSNIHPKKRKKYLKLFNKYDVTAVFFGHYHRNAYPDYKEIELIITSAIGMQHGDDSSGFRIVKVFNDRIEHNYYGLENVPDKVLFN